MSALQCKLQAVKTEEYSGGHVGTIKDEEIKVIIICGLYIASMCGSSVYYSQLTMYMKGTLNASWIYLFPGITLLCIQQFLLRNLFLLHWLLYINSNSWSDIQI